MHYQWQDENLLIHCLVQPKASKDEIAGVHNQMLKVRLTAPPVDGKANQALIKLLARLFSVPKSRVSLVRGETSRQKTVLIIAPSSLPQDTAVTRSA